MAEERNVSTKVFVLWPDGTVHGAAESSFAFLVFGLNQYINNNGLSDNMHIWVVRTNNDYLRGLLLVVIFVYTKKNREKSISI